MNDLAEIILKDSETVQKTVDFSALSGKTVLITGASGIVGTYLLATLKSAWTKGLRFELTAVSKNPPLPYQKLLLDYPGAKSTQIDLSDYQSISKLPDADFIIHAAGYGQPGKFLEDPVKTLKINTLATFALLEKLRARGKFLFISSSEIYTGLSDPPFKESYIGTSGPDHKRSSYIEGKRSGEAIVNAYRQNGTEAKSARLALAYGPGTKLGDKRVLNSFIEKGLQGKIDLLDQGTAKRTYCYITDAVEYLWKILLLGKEPVYNVGGNSKVTIKELADKIGAYTGAKIYLPKNSDGLSGSPENVWLDMTKSGKEFDKKSYVGLDEGLKRTIDWQKILYKP